MLGVNELGWKGTDIFRGHAENLSRRLKSDHPDAELVIQSLLPVSTEQDAKGSYVNNQRILAYNQVWRELAEENGCAYVDVAEALTGEDGCLPEEFLAVCEDEDTAFLLDFLPCNLRKDDCLATACRHDEEKAALALLPFFLDGIDGLFLIRPEFHMDSSFPAKTVPVWPNIIILFCS